MGKSSATSSRAQGAQDNGSGAEGSKGSKGVAGKTLPEWVTLVCSVGNKSGAVGDFMGAVTGTPLTKQQYARMAKIYKDFPGGLEALMAAICFTAIKDPKGDPLDYLQKIADKKRGVKPKGSRQEGFSRDEYVES